MSEERWFVGGATGAEAPTKNDAYRTAVDTLITSSMRAHKLLDRLWNMSAALLMRT